jgi:hypothetical protein
VFTSTVISAARISLGVFVGQNAASGLHDRQAGVIFTGNHFQAILLTDRFGVNRVPHGWILLLQRIHSAYFSMMRVVNRVRPALVQGKTPVPELLTSVGRPSMSAARSLRRAERACFSGSFSQNNAKKWEIMFGLSLLYRIKR